MSVYLYRPYFGLESSSSPHPAIYAPHHIVVGEKSTTTKGQHNIHIKYNKGKQKTTLAICRRKVTRLLISSEAQKNFIIYSYKN